MNKRWKIFCVLFMVLTYQSFYMSPVYVHYTTLHTLRPKLHRNTTATNNFQMNRMCYPLRAIMSSNVFEKEKKKKMIIKTILCGLRRVDLYKSFLIFSPANQALSVCFTNEIFRFLHTGKWKQIRSVACTM